MKRNPIIFLIILVFSASCGKPKLTKELAAELIIKENYTPPRSYNLNIYCADPSFAAKMMNAGLEKDEMVTIQKTYMGSETGDSLIRFTKKSNPFKLETSPELQKRGVQIVKVADFKFGGVTAIRDQGNGQPIEVDYDQVSANVNSFSKLANYDFKQVKHKTATFTFDKKNGYLIVAKKTK